MAHFLTRTWTLTLALNVQHQCSNAHLTLALTLTLPNSVLKTFHPNPDPNPNPICSGVPTESPDCDISQAHHLSPGWHHHGRHQLPNLTPVTMHVANSQAIRMLASTPSMPLSVAFTLPHGLLQVEWGCRSMLRSGWRLRRLCDLCNSLHYVTWQQPCSLHLRMLCW